MAGNADARLKALEKEQKAIQDKQEELQKELMALQVRVSALGDVLADNNWAMLYVFKYMGAFAAELNARGLMITQAIARFNTFLDLPSNSNNFGAVLDFAFALLAAAVPVLRLTGLLARMEKNATLALEIAKNEPQWLRYAPVMNPAAAQVVVRIAPTGEVVERMKKVNDVRSKGVAVFKNDPDGFSALKKLDSTKGPIRELVAYANSSMSTFNKVLDVLGKEVENRLRHPELKYKESVLDMAKRLLEMPERLNESDLDEIELAYLWFMIGRWAKENAKYLDASVYSDVKGINDAQKVAILQLFGPGAKRGRHFRAPMIFNIGMFLGAWDVPIQHVQFEGKKDQRERGPGRI